MRWPCSLLPLEGICDLPLEGIFDTVIVLLMVTLFISQYGMSRVFCHASVGQFVPRVQMIRGIPFSYQPPPRTIVPHAAGLKGQGTRCALHAHLCTAGRPAGTLGIMLCYSLSLGYQDDLWHAHSNA